MLAKYLEDNSRRLEPNFDMGNWGNTCDSMRAGANLTSRDFAKCGTAACAIGHAGSIWRFRWAGFKIENDPFRGAVAKYKGHEDIEAIKAFFEIGYQTLLSLFVPSSYQGRPAPVDVAKRIQAYVANGLA